MRGTREEDGRDGYKTSSIHQVREKLAKGLMVKSRHRSNKIGIWIDHWMELKYLKTKISRNTKKTKQIRRKDNEQLLQLFRLSLVSFLNYTKKNLHKNDACINVIMLIKQD